MEKSREKVPGRSKEMGCESTWSWRCGEFWGWHRRQGQEDDTLVCDDTILYSEKFKAAAEGF